MKVSLIQMDMRLGDPDYNFEHAKTLILGAVDREAPDVVVLPETWNTGFFPKENLAALCDRDGLRVRSEIGGLAAERKVNIVAGSVANIKQGKVYNTALVFNREGTCVAEYDKTHLFTPMGEHEFFEGGDHTVNFTLDGVRCGLIICYDVRFPELVRTVALQGADVFFVVSQWPAIRIPHVNVLTETRAIENQMFVAYCNSCGVAGETKYGGSSSLVDPWGVVLRRAGDQEEIVTGELDLGVVEGIRRSINVFRDRRPALYQVGKGGPQ